ncbi:MAG: beta-galactosidase GalB [Verrucomicrobiota bacterium]
MRFKLHLAATVLSLIAALSATPTSRTSFDGDWKFTRFGKMPDGSHLPEPGAPPVMTSGSSFQTENPVKHAFDGKEETRWCASSDAAGQWLQVDLGRHVELGSTRIVWEKDSGNPFSIEVSADSKSWKAVVPKNEATGADQSVPTSATARYLKLKVDGIPGAWASVREFEIFDPAGKKLEPEAPTVPNPPPTPDEVDYDDSSWRVLDLPHDWAIEGPFSMAIENETGKLPWEGIGWYRKTFDVPASAKNRRIYIDFDGAMAQPKVYINGHFAGDWAYGYNSFRIDATPHLKFGEPNTIAVRLQNLPASTRWYPGAGIYRHVWLVESPAVHIAHWGTYVTTPEIGEKEATVEVETTVDNTTDTTTKLTLRTEVIDEGTVVASKESRLESKGVTKTASRLQVATPKRWDTENPFLYTLRTTLLKGDRVIDRSETPFGIRSIEWHVQKGFLLNGRKVFLKGVCNHHDLGPLGAAVHTRAIERQIEILKEMGCNSIRTAHNPPTPELLHLCDRMGILVIDELFDIWKLAKHGKPNGYNLYWDEWVEKDVRNFMLRDRNHPSIIAWSTGNEIPELGATDYHWVPAKLKELMKRYDTTRPVTAGSNNPNAATNGFQKTVDVYGVNYWMEVYADMEKALPDTPLYASETSSTVSTRGEYFFPVDWDRGKGFYDFQVSSYDLYAPGWGNRPDLQFEMLDKHPRFAGQYVWTGFDYIGEPTPYNLDQSNALNFRNPEERAKAMKELERLGHRAPSRSSYFGILDLCGFKKDRFYIYQARWRPDHPMVHILPHWNWPERSGKVTPVHVYTTGDEAELFLNGKSLGKRRIGEPHGYRLTWDEVKYAPGKLEVVATKDGKTWAKWLMETTGEASRIGLTADRPQIAADGNDLSYLTIRILDAEGRVVPRTRIPVEISTSGPVEIAGIGNGNPKDHNPMKPANPVQAEIIAFNGLAQVIIRSKSGESGEAEIQLKAEGLQGASLKLETR